jgi:hypothetical protein
MRGVRKRGVKDVGREEEELKPERKRGDRVLTKASNQVSGDKRRKIISTEEDAGAGGEATVVRVSEENEGECEGKGRRATTLGESEPGNSKTRTRTCARGSGRPKVRVQRRGLGYDF